MVEQSRVELLLVGDKRACSCYGPRIRREVHMSDKDRVYFAQRAAEEEKMAGEAQDKSAQEAHRKLQRAYLERASVGDRPGSDEEASA